MFANESDAHLVDQARQGVAAAFAVLVHRHADKVFNPAASNPRKSAVKSFVGAMRQLADDEAHQDFGSWLSEKNAGSDVSNATGDARTRTFTDDDIDAIWADLARRWPNGRRSFQLPHAGVWVLTAIATIAISAMVPWLLLTQFGEEPSIQELRAFPIYDERDEEPAQIDQLDELDGAEDPLPTFEFPTPPEAVDEPAEPDGDDADAEPEPAADDVDADESVDPDEADEGDENPDDASGNGDQGDDEEQGQTGSDDNANANG